MEFKQLTTDIKESMAAIGDQCTYKKGALLGIDQENDRISL